MGEKGQTAPRDPKMGEGHAPMAAGTKSPKAALLVLSPLIGKFDLGGGSLLSLDRSPLGITMTDRPTRCSGGGASKHAPTLALILL